MYKIYYTTTGYGPWTVHDLLNELAIFYHNCYDAEIITRVKERVYIPEFDCKIMDCESLIYNTHNDMLKIISFAERPSEMINVLKKRNKETDRLIIVHGLSWSNSVNKINNRKFKVYNTTFYPFSPKINYNYYYNLRQLKKYHNDITDKIFFRTTTGRGDEKELLSSGITNEAFKPIPFDQYLNMAINYKIGLSISTNVYEICHRDFDYMAIGLPMMRVEMLGSYFPKLIPNHHYISIDRKKYNLPDNIAADRIGGEAYIKEYKDRFFEVKDDYELLDFISKNANEYYRKYSAPESRLNLLLDILNKDNKDLNK